MSAALSGLSSPPRSVSEWLTLASARLHDHSDSPRLDAELLLGVAAGIARSRIHARPEAPLNPDQLIALDAALARRARGEPLAYIAGQQEFWSLPLHVSPDVLVPRPETELLVEWALELAPKDQPCRILDLGVGSGAVALAIAKERPQAHITAVDISRAALQIAARNRDALGLRHVELIASDWFDALGERRFDIIVGNPPYVAENDPELAPAVAAFEPRRAVVAGPTGLEAIERIVAGAAAHLTNGGALLLEHGWRQAPIVRKLLEQAGFSGVTSRRDLADRDRVVAGWR